MAIVPTRSPPMEMETPSSSTSTRLPSLRVRRVMAWKTPPPVPCWLKPTASAWISGHQGSVFSSTPGEGMNRLAARPLFGEADGLGMHLRRAGYQIVHIAAQGFLSRITEEPLRSRIPGQDASVQPHHHNRHRNMLEHRLEALLLASQLGLSLFVGAD